MQDLPVTATLAYAQGHSPDFGGASPHDLAYHNSVKTERDSTPACVLGSVDLVRPLHLAGIRCVAVAPPESPVHHSRFVEASVEWADPWTAGGRLVDNLIRFAQTCPEPPVLFYEEDRDLLLVSRERDRLAHYFRFVIPEAALVEDLVDKSRLDRLAKRLGLPMPRSRAFAPLPAAPPDELDLDFPVILKPLTRRGLDRWAQLTLGKALRVDTPERLSELWPLLTQNSLDLIIQELVSGPESQVESYHAYIDRTGKVVGEFTGRKIRTKPPENGFSTAVEITRNGELAELGRELVGRLGLRGVAKFDFKRSRNNGFVLFEVNPRFSLWHHPGAIAGVNLPALVYADLTGRPRPRITAVRPGVRWFDARHDAFAAREHGLPLWRWLLWALGTDTLAWNDPMPFIGSVVGWHKLRRRRRA
jgi:predicted ATP-grasp superfamily ATP-dependent carboligase